MKTNNKTLSHLMLIAFNKIVFTTIIFLLTVIILNAQPVKYTIANAHSHNDYENKCPFVTAYNENFGSIEADIFLWNDSLIVGHTIKDIVYKRTLEKLYLEPLNKAVETNNGYPYKNHSLELQLLIDVKTAALPTINRLVKMLAAYPLLIHSAKIKFVITGNRPADSTYHIYPSFILFDGNISKNYATNDLKKIGMFSDDLKKYTQWNGVENIPAKDKAVLDACINKAHRLNKKIRFWDAPDTEYAWQQMVGLKVDFINTDHIVELSDFLKKQP